MCDFSPEDWTTFWTSAIYFVTDASTATTVNRVTDERLLGTRQKSAMQCRLVRAMAVMLSSDHDWDDNDCQGYFSSIRISATELHTERIHLKLAYRVLASAIERDWTTVGNAEAEAQV